MGGFMQWMPGLGREANVLSQVLDKMISDAVALVQSKGPITASMLPLLGKQIIAGMVAGISQAMPQLHNQMDAVANVITDVVTNKLGIKSPSRVFAGFGGNIIAGLVQGLLAGQGAVASAVTSVANTATLAVSGARAATIAGITRAGAGVQGVQQATVVIQLDGRQIARKTIELTPQILRMKGVA
jgi:hypothetical protein